MKCYMIKIKDKDEEALNRTELKQRIDNMDKYEEFTIRR